MLLLVNGYVVYLVVGWLSIVGLGIVLGLMNKITVFRDFDDLGLVFLNVVLPIALFLGFKWFQIQEQLVSQLFIGAVTLGIFVFVIHRTSQDNHLAGVLIALITKVSLSIIFIVNFLDFVAPSAESWAERSKKRRRGLVLLLAIAPICYKLVRKKEGIFNPFSGVPGPG